MMLQHAHEHFCSRNSYLSAEKNLNSVTVYEIFLRKNIKLWQSSRTVVSYMHRINVKPEATAYNFTSQCSWFPGQVDMIWIKALRQNCLDIYTFWVTRYDICDYFKICSLILNCAFVFWMRGNTFFLQISCPPLLRHTSESKHLYQGEFPNLIVLVIFEYHLSF